MLKVLVMVSGGGTNLQAIIDSVENGTITNTKIVGVISNNQNAYALERAGKHGISAECISPKNFENRAVFNEKLLERVNSYEPDLIVLAGFLVVIPPEMIAAYRNRLINIHPSLIPAFCGTGYYNGTFCGRGNRYRSDHTAESGGSGMRRYAGNSAAARDGAG